MVLRDVEQTDLPVLYEHQRDPEASQMAGFIPRDRAAFMLHWQHTVLANPAGEKRTIVVEHEIAGNILSWDDNGKRLVGYWIANAYWGRGVATLALRQFLIAHERTRPVFAYVAVTNLGSRRVLEKCGFVPVGPAEADELLMVLA